MSQLLAKIGSLARNRRPKFKFNQYFEPLPYAIASCGSFAKSVVKISKMQAQGPLVRFGSCFLVYLGTRSGARNHWSGWDGVISSQIPISLQNSSLKRGFGAT